MSNTVFGCRWIHITGGWLRVKTGDRITSLITCHKDAACHHSSLNTNHKHHHASSKLPFYFIRSFCQVLLEDKCSATKYICFHLHIYFFTSSDRLAICSNGDARLLPNCCCSSAGGSNFLTCFHLFELLLELLRSEAVVVEAIVPFDSLQHLQVTTHQPITSLHHHLSKEINKSL